jgi:hypothetical protein
MEEQFSTDDRSIGLSPDAVDAVDHRAAQVVGYWEMSGQRLSACQMTLMTRPQAFVCDAAMPRGSMVRELLSWDARR